ncbi:MAG: hypothetical protein V2B18_08040 [Pseudomonadota bacterium]
MFGRRTRYRTYVIVLYILLLGAGEGFGDDKFDVRGWKHLRNILVTPGIPNPITLPLDCGILQKCRPDGADLAVVSADGRRVVSRFRQASGSNGLEPFPVRVFRMAKRPGKWTEVWIDKTSKILSDGISFKTSSKDFVRQVEIRGSDNTKEMYIVRIDGLIADFSSTAGFRTLTIDHQVNNFRYLYVRILDGDQQSLKIDGISCRTPSPAPDASIGIAPRIIANSVDSRDKSSRLVLDLGEDRYPATGLTIAASLPSFVRKVTLFDAESPSDESPKPFFDGVMFRLRRGEAVKELLSSRFPPSCRRYVVMRIAGGKEGPIEVGDVTAEASNPLLAFDAAPGQDYRLYYGNADAPRHVTVKGESPEGPLALVQAPSIGVALGPEEKIVPPPEKRKAKETVRRESPESLSQPGRWYWEPAGMIIILAGLLLLFAVMLRTRSAKRESRIRFNLPRR